MSRPPVDHARLEQVVRDLETTWEASRDVWRDHARLDFATDHLDPILDEIRVAIGDLRRLEQLLTEAVKACN